jgi:hypothetical protein
MCDSKEKIGDAIDQLDLLHRLFINHGDYGGVIQGWKTYHRASRQTTCRRSDYNTYSPLGRRIVEVGGSRLLSS